MKVIERIPLPVVVLAFWCVVGMVQSMMRRRRVRLANDRRVFRELLRQEPSLVRPEVLAKRRADEIELAKYADRDCLCSEIESALGALRLDDPMKQIRILHTLLEGLSEQCRLRSKLSSDSKLWALVITYGSGVSGSPLEGRILTINSAVRKYHS